MSESGKRLKNMTLAELDALPVEGYRWKTQVIDGREVETPVLPDVGATWFAEDEPQWYIDRCGVRWRFARRLSDGAWCRLEV